MADDIVTRLREYEAIVDHPFVMNILVESANEIERLRQEVNNAVAKANAYYELVQAYRWSHAHLAEWPDAISSLVAENHELRKAVRGES